MEVEMSVTNKNAIIMARKWLENQQNLPKAVSYSLGKLGNDTETGGKKFSILVANPEDMKGPFITILVFLVSEDSIKILEDNRPEHQHIWS